LTNALDEGVTASETLGDLAWYISQEASEAAQVKKNTPIMVIVGNPPYSNFGMLNKNDWIRGLLETYKRGLNEKKINLDDDYIKFIRFGQWRIEQTGQGILALITNNSFIDGLYRHLHSGSARQFKEAGESAGRLKG
jgi:predicted helicase